MGKIPWRRKWKPTPTFLPGKLWTEEPGRLQFMGPQRVSTTECAHTWVSFCFKRMHSPLVFRVSSALITTGPLIMPCLCRRLPAGMEFCTLQSTWGLELHSIGALLCLGDSRLAVCHVGRRVLWRGMGSLAQPPTLKPASYALLPECCVPWPWKRSSRPYSSPPHRVFKHLSGPHAFTCDTVASLMACG